MSSFAHALAAISASLADKADGDAPRKGFTALKRSGKSWAASDGSALSEAMKKRLADLTVPPAWTGVQISDDPDAKLQVVGKDDKDRPQYLYSEAHHEQAASDKFARVKQMLKALPGLKSRIDAALKSSNEADREAAGVLKLIAITGIRIGSKSDTGADEQAYGASTLQARHVTLGPGGKVHLKFVGKKAVLFDRTIRDQSLHDLLSDRVKKGGQLFDTTDGDVRDFLHKIGGKQFKVKDFRTAVAAHTALAIMKRIGPPRDGEDFKARQKQVAEKVAAKLGNTPQVALDSYIPPEVFTAWRAASGSKD